MTQPASNAVHEKIVSELHAALAAWYGGDPWPYVQLFAEDLTYFAPVTRGRLEGRTALRDLFAPIAGKISVPRFEVIAPLTQLFGELAVLTYGVNEYGADGAIMRMWNATDVLRETNGEWRRVHTHWSSAPT